MKYEKAYRIAEEFLRALEPFCDRVQIAGSLRRHKSNVGDIEMVAISKSIDSPGMLPGLNRTDGLTSFPYHQHGTLVLNGDRQKKIALSSGIYLDLFIVRKPAQWGPILAIRTGPADFSKWLVTPRRYGGAMPSDCRLAGGRVQRNNVDVSLPEEIDFLTFLGLGFIDPQYRTVLVGNSMLNMQRSGSTYVICPACHGSSTGPRLAGTGGCNTCNGNGVINA